MIDESGLVIIVRHESDLLVIDVATSEPASLTYSMETNINDNGSIYEEDSKLGMIPPINILTDEGILCKRLQAKDNKERVIIQSKRGDGANKKGLDHWDVNGRDLLTLPEYVDLMRCVQPHTK